MITQLSQDSIALLDRLIATPSVSRDEAATADIIEEFLRCRVKGEVKRIYNNVYVRTPLWNDNHPTLLMNSHHDTVKPSASYTRNPYEPTHEEGRIYGLGSNDAGASLVSLVATFCNNIANDLPIQVNNRETVMHLVYIDDVVKSFVGCLDVLTQRSGGAEGALVVRG